MMNGDNGEQKRETMEESNDDDNTSTLVKTDHAAMDVQEDEEAALGGNEAHSENERQPSHTNQFDNSLLHQAVADGGRWAYGVIFVEVWVMNKTMTQLFRPESGWWIDPVYHSNCAENCKVCRVVDPTREDYVEAEPLCPGEGLPGVLWADSRRVMDASASETSGMRRTMFAKSKPPEGPTLFKVDTTNPHDTVAWREVKTIASDPDQPFNPRLQLLAELGLGMAAAVPFNFHGEKGIVVYMAREHVNMNRLRSSSNELYLKAACSLIGSAYALREPRHQMQNQRNEELDVVIRRVRTKIIMLIRAGHNFKDVVKENDRKVKRFSSFRDFRESKKLDKCKKWVKFAGKKITTAVIKSKGAGNQPPPPSNWEQTSWTFAGCFITLLMVCRLNVYLFDVYGPDFTIVLGPFGALVTLMYGLTAAPASQPRSAIAGQTISLTIALGISYADNMSIWMRQALATSLAVATMAKMGVTHPPGGAAALLFASGKFGWGNMLFVLVGNVIAIGTATIINNFSDYRQYPTFWGLQYTIDAIKKYARDMGGKKAD